MIKIGGIRLAVCYIALVSYHGFSITNKLGNYSSHLHSQTSTGSGVSRGVLFSTIAFVELLNCTLELLVKGGISSGSLAYNAKIDSPRPTSSDSDFPHTIIEH